MISKNVQSRDPIVKYLSEISSVRLFDSDREVEAFRNIEAAEGALVMHLVKNESVRETLLEFSNSIDGKENPDYKAAVLSVARTRKSLSKLAKLFLRAVRFTDEGREWYEKTLRSIKQKIHGDDWATEASQLLEVVVRLKNAFVQANLRFVISIAKKRWRPWMNQNLADLVQEGNIGLMKAVERFDVEKGFKFSTYSMWWIRHHIQRAVSDKDALIRHPVHMSDLNVIIAKAETKHKAQTGEDLSESDLVKITGQSEKKIHNALLFRGNRAVMSLDAPTSTDSDSAFVDNVPDSGAVDAFDTYAQSQLINDMKSLLTSLNPMESSVLRWRFGFDGDPQTLKEIADRFNLSRERIRQIEEVALQKLRSKRRVYEYARQQLKAV